MNISEKEMFHFPNAEGEQAGRPLILIHGLGGSMACFNEALNFSWRDKPLLIMVDLLGARFMEKCRDNHLSFSQQADCLCNQISDLGLNSFDLLGHSYGATLGTLVAARSPNCSSFINVEGHVTESMFDFLRIIERRSFLPEYERWFDEDLIKGAGALAADKNIGAERYVESLMRWQPEVFAYCARSLLDFCDPTRDGTNTVLEAFCALQVPELYINGSESVKNEEITMLRKRGIPISSVSGSHHWPMIEAPETFYRIVSCFVREQSIPI
ncbi:alpha/beta fold hydrolase [Mangrovicoccus sp. HB161399]|uniref:alpha/beta fold hydrolase n=1 Tax=Mangrovicoccus sp. HB161399 TaxID=2720392 RepID=UPI001552549C|nr:alpha/beta hydrolase [Mangrovicoccus sp. HB161399]